MVGSPISSLQRYQFCTLVELSQKKSITRWVEELRDEIMAVFSAGEIFVISSVCPHFAGELEVDWKNKDLRCKWHAWRFELQSGQCKTHNVKTCVRHYDYAVVDDFVVIEVK